MHHPQHTRTRRAALAVLGTALATALSTALPLVPGAVPAAQAAGEVPRIMLVGDSQTIGTAGDFTWRYRLDRHLRSVGQQFDFVGPREDMVDHVTGVLSGSTDYADPAFDRDHFAAWGKMLHTMRDDVVGAAQTYTPDVYVVLGGTNDLLWGVNTPEGTAEVLGDLVTRARTVTPDAAFVLTEPPRGDRPEEARFATLLPALAARLSTEASPVVVAHAQAGYTDADTWDGGHPHAGGEVKIAAAVADALALVGIGTDYPRPLPVVPLGPTRPAVVRASLSGTTALLTVDSAPGTTAEHVWHRDVSVRGPWALSPNPVSGSTWSASGLRLGHTYAFRTQAAKGRLTATSFSAPVHVALAPRRAASSRAVLRRRGLAVVRWTSAPGAASYVVQRRLGGGPWRTVSRSAGTVARISGNRPAARYAFRVLPIGVNGVRGPATVVSPRRL
ncbi:GDSL-type esterase/lipase family protein [Nocardioides pacificus]